MHLFISFRIIIFIHIRFYSNMYMFLFLRDAKLALIKPGGFVDKDMYFGHVHMLKLIAIL